MKLPVALALDFEGFKEVRGQVEKFCVLINTLGCAQPGWKSGHLFQLLNTDL